MSAMTNQMIFGAANIGGEYATSEKCLDITSRARRAAADLFGGDPTEITFGNNMTTLTFHVAHAIASATFEPGDNVLLSALDHDANVGPWVRLAEDRGVEVRWIPVVRDACTLDLDEGLRRLDERTRVVACGYASNAVGTINDVRRVCDAARDVGALSFIDAVHYAPHGLLDVVDVGCDMMASSPYKYYGPHSGLLYGRAEVMDRLRPYKIRPASDDRPSIANYELSCWELGTQNFEALAGIEACVEYVASLGSRFGEIENDVDRRERIVAAWRVVEEHENALKTIFLNAVSEIEGLTVYGIDDATRVQDRTATFAIAMDGMSAETLTSTLCMSGLFCTSGNHYCTFWEDALGVSNETGATRLGFLHYTTEEDVRRVVDVLAGLRRTRN